MTKQKKNAKKSKKQLFTHSKLIISLLILLSLPLISSAYNKYKDWDNAQLIRGLASDFPELVGMIEQETGLSLDMDTNCHTTQEKFGSGVRTCEISVAKITEVEVQDKARTAVISSDFSGPIEAFEYNEGFNFQYRAKNSCDMAFNVGEATNFTVSCIAAVRDANIELAKEVFLDQ